MPGPWASALRAGAPTEPVGPPCRRRLEVSKAAGQVVLSAMFVGSLAMEALLQSQAVQVAIDTLRKGAAPLLLVTPVARLVLAGTMLGLRGEWRYTACAAAVLGLLALAVGAGISG